MTKNDAFYPAMGFEYVGACLKAIGERRYRDALTLLDEGINKQLKCPQDVNAGALLKHVGALVAYLDFRLNEDFGTQWEVQPNESDQTEIRCSFCGKRELEVDRIITGPGAFICNDCIQICADTLAKE